MIKIIAQYECEVEGKIGRFYMHHDTPTSTARGMANAFLDHLDKIEEQAKSLQADEEAKAQIQVEEQTKSE